MAVMGLPWIVTWPSGPGNMLVDELKMVALS
jgi:hypothetical protein